MVVKRRAVFILSWAALGSVAAIAAQSISSTGEPQSATSSLDPSIAVEEGQSPTEPRLREGIRLQDAIGHFESAADVPVFIDEQGRRLIGLENLNLQRIVRTVLAAEDPATLRWRVSGAITEYEGRNYIFIERAVYSPSRQ
jgi:hypothetical protein